MKRTFVIVHFQKQHPPRFLKQNKVKGLFNSFSQFLSHAKLFDSREEAESYIINEIITSPVKIEEIFLRTPKKLTPN